MSSFFLQLLLIFNLQFNEMFDNEHPIHVAVIDIEFNTESSILEIGIKIFTDDLENTLSQNMNSKIDFYQNNNTEVINKKLKEYLSKTFKIQQEGKLLTLEILGQERDKEAVHIYLQSGKLKNSKKLELNTTILHELFDDQIILVNCVKMNLNKTTQIIYPNSSMDLEFF